MIWKRSMKFFKTNSNLSKFLVTGSLSVLIFCSSQEGISEEIESKQKNSIKVQLASIESAGRLIVNIDSWPEIIGQEMPVQMKITHTPNINGQCHDETSAAQAAMTLTQRLLENSHDIQLQAIERGDGFYLLADVISDGINVSEEVSALLTAAKKSGENQWCKPALRAGGKFKIKRN